MKLALKLTTFLAIYITANIAVAVWAATPSPASPLPLPLPDKANGMVAANTPEAPVASEINSAPVVPPARKKENGPPSLFDDDQVSVQQLALLDVRIKVPHRINPDDVFNLYPYPVKPPKAHHTPPLPQTMKDIKGLLLSTGYLSPGHPDKPFQAGGWRFQYCFHTATVKSGLGMPHTILTEYGWVNDIAPYVLRETKRWNKFEDTRWARYNKAVAEYDQNHADAESEAMRQGILPMQLNKRGYGWVRTYIQPGSWWLTCTRKVPGLTYYWLVPLTAAAGEKINVELNELNALVIEGAW